MAKITALTADAAVLDTDVTVTVEDPGGTPVTKKATWATIGVLFAARSETLTNKTINGASNTLTVRLASDVSGTLPVANGGTGITALGAGMATWWGTPSGANLASTLTSSLPNTKGGTGQDSSGWTGLAKVAAGTWSALTLGANVETLLGTFSSANLAAALTDETGSGAAVFGTSPTLTTPQVNGGRIEATTFRWDGETTNASTGTLNNVSLGGNRILRCTHASGATITGFDATGVEDGEVLLVRSIGNVLTLNHEDAGSSAGNRMTLPGAVARSQSGSVVGIFIYDATAARWFMPSGWYVL